MNQEMFVCNDGKFKMVNVSAAGSQSPSAGVFPWTLTTRAHYFYGHEKDVEEHEGLLL